MHLRTLSSSTGSSGRLLLVLCAWCVAARASQVDASHSPSGQEVAQPVSALLQHLESLRQENFADDAERVWQSWRAAAPAEREIALQVLADATFGTDTSNQPVGLELVSLLLARVESCSTQALAGANLGPDLVLDCLQILARLGQAEQLSWVPSLVLAAAGAEQDAALARSYEDCLTALLMRDEASWAELARLIERLPAGLCGLTLRALGATDSASALPVLGRFLEREDELKGAALSQMLRLTRNKGLRPAAAILELVRRELSSPRKQVRDQAILIAGACSDEDAIDVLIALLADDEPGVRKNARWALEQVTGLAFREDSSRWQLWHANEVTWWGERAAGTFQDLRSGERAEVVAAVHEIATHRLYRSELVRRLAPLLIAGDADLAVLACRALGSLRSLAAIPFLIPVLQAPEARLRAASHQALKSIAQLDLPPEPRLWRERFPSQRQE